MEWIQGERIPQSRIRVVLEITSLANHCKLWPMATMGQWNEAIDAAVKQNLITESDGVLKLIAVAATEPEPTEVKQLELF